MRKWNQKQCIKRWTRLKEKIRKASQQHGKGTTANEELAKKHEEKKNPDS
jgi:hypothetical protein